MPDILAHYRIRKNSVSSNKLIQAKFHWQLYHEIEGMNVVMSAWYVLCWAWVKGTHIGIDRQNV